MPFTMKTKQIINLILLGFLFILWSCQKEDNADLNPVQTLAPQQGFITFTSTGQTLPTAIHNNEKQVKFEVDHNVDVTRLVPEFSVPQGYKVFLNGVEQLSGTSEVDFTQPVTYLVKDGDNRQASWEATAIKLKKKILIDASHDGGVWWFPQSPLTGFDQKLPHQGQAFANLLRAKGFEVDELGRDAGLTEEMFFGYYIIIRANGFQSYTSKELEVYTNLVKRGMRLVFFTDHKKYDPTDELGNHLGLKFSGIAYGKISTFAPHVITENINSIDYIAGSVLMDAAKNPNIQILGWLGNEDYADLNFNGTKDENEPLAPPVMGILKYPKSKIFFIGDMNGLQVMPQPFIDNLIKWMGDDFITPQY
jgi:hypothetical protein